MASHWTTAIQLAAIRTAGEVDSRIDITRAGTPDMEAHVTVGAHLVRIADRKAAQRVAATWRDAALHVHRLPQRAGLPEHRRPDAECPAGLVIRIGRDAAARQDLLPPEPPKPARLRVQFGPLVWMVADQAAYASMRALWDQVEDLM